MNRLIKVVLAICFALSISIGRTQVAMWIETTDGEEGTPLHITVKTSGFEDMAYFQFSLKWDPAILQFSALDGLNENLGLEEESNFGTDSTGNGKLMALWFSSSGTGQSIPDPSVLFEVEYMVTGEEGDASVVCFSDEPIPIAFGNADGPVTPGLTNGTFEIFDTMLVTAAITHNNCFGDTSGAIGLSVSGGSGQHTFSWENGLSSGNMEGLAAGNYTVTITDLQTQNSIDTTFAVTQPPPLMVIEINATPDTNGLGVGWASVAHSGGTPPYSYEWGTSPPQTDSIATGLSSGDYGLTITDNNDCRLDTVIAILTPTKNLSSRTKLKVYPNPARDYLVVEIESAEATSWSFEIVNASGEAVVRQSFSTLQKRLLIPAVSDFPPGLYIIRIQSKVGTVAKRFVKLE